MIELPFLKQECLTAFENYAQEAQKTCGLLSELEGNSPSLERLLAILAQTQIEEQAQGAYLQLREQLFGLLETSTIFR